jgi:hypothetical protein
MATPTPEQRRNARRRARNRRVPVCLPGDRPRWIAVHLRPEQHGTATAREFHQCECVPCMDAIPPHNDPERRAANRRAAIARRELVGGRLVAVDLSTNKHGTANASDYHKCACHICTEAARARRARRNRREAGHLRRRDYPAHHEKGETVGIFKRSNDNDGNNSPGQGQDAATTVTQGTRGIAITNGDPLFAQRIQRARQADEQARSEQQG